MNPLILAPAVVSRVGPWLGRLAASRPGFLTALLSKLRAGGATVGAGVSGIVNYFKSSPAAAGLTLASIASFGVSVRELFNGVDGVEKDDELTGLLNGLDDVAMAWTARQRGDSEREILEMGSISEKLDLKLAKNEVKTLSAIEILSWARSHYGSEKAALRAHRLEQAFFEMPYEDVRTGYATLKLN